MQPSDLTKSPPPAPTLLPPVAVSIADGVAAVTISPFTRDLTDAERAAILAADRQRIFIRAWGDAKPTASPAHIKFSDYPSDTIKWCIDHASLICVGVLNECQNPSETDVEALLSHFDRDDVAEHRFVIRLIVDAQAGVTNDLWLQRPREAPIVHSGEKEASGTITAFVYGGAPIHSTRRDVH
jgi:hypothetical protein